MKLSAGRKTAEQARKTDGRRGAPVECGATTRADGWTRGRSRRGGGGGEGQVPGPRPADGAAEQACPSTAEEFDIMHAVCRAVCPHRLSMSNDRPALTQIARMG